MEKLSLVMVYQLGKYLWGLAPQESDLTGERPIDTKLRIERPLECLHSFLHQMKNAPCPRTLAAAKALDEQYAELQEAALRDNQSTDNSVLTRDVARRIDALFAEFERELEIDSPRLPIFCLTEKGDLDITILLENATKKYPADLRKVMPVHVLDDVREAGRCLVFELPTACAFHVCRATEGLMRAYYKKLTESDWPPPPPSKLRRDWAVLVGQLGVSGAPKKITQRLDEVREDRNSFAHPDVTVSLEDGPIVYGLCTNIMHLMAKEMI